MVPFQSSPVVMVADCRFSAGIRLQQEANRTPNKECRLQLGRVERCPEL